MTDTPPPVAPTAGAPLSAAEDKQWASFAHLGNILGFLPPLIIWLVFKDRGRFTDQEGKEALNWAITVAIALVATSIIVGIPFVGLISFLLWPAILIANLVFAILGFVAVNGGQPYRYPVAIRLIK